MAWRNVLTARGVRQLAQQAVGSVCLSMIVAAPLCVMPLPAHAQGAAGEEDISLDFVKQQLARVRAGTPAAAEAGQALQDENARLLAEESALLNQLSGSDSTANTEGTTRASADMDRAIDALTAPKAVVQTAPVAKAVQPVSAASESEPIDIVRGSIPSVHAPSTLSANTGLSASEGDKQPASKQEAIIAKVSAPSHEEQDPVDVLLASESSVTSRTASRPEVAEPASGSATMSTTKLSSDAESNARISEQQKTVANLQRTNTEMRRQVETLQRKLRDATKELEDSRNRLMIAETEVERLSMIVEQRNRANLVRGAPGVAQAQPVRAYRAPQAQQQISTQQSRTSGAGAAPATESAKVKPDMLVATVIADKANLRSGAGKNNSPLMTVSRGTRLAVETRTGEWYRVITPTGTRAWVNAEVLSFGPSGQASPTRTVRISGVGSDDHATVVSSR